MFKGEEMAELRRYSRWKNMKCISSIREGMRDRDEDFVIREGVVVSSSLLVKSTKSFLGGMTVSLIFLEGLEEEAWVEAMEVEKE
nr:hypothetical protein [Tanacetum cinerariifolium]